MGLWIRCHRLTIVWSFRDDMRRHQPQYQIALVLRIPGPSEASSDVRLRLNLEGLLFNYHAMGLDLLYSPLSFFLLGHGMLWLAYLGRSRYLGNALSAACYGSESGNRLYLNGTYHALKTMREDTLVLNIARRKDDYPESLNYLTSEPFICSSTYQARVSITTTQDPGIWSSQI